MGFFYVSKSEICKIRQNIKLFNIVLVCNMLINDQKVKIQCAKVKNMSNSGKCLHLGSWDPTAHAQNRLDMPFKADRCKMS